MITSPVEVRGETAKAVTGTKRDKQRIIFQATIHHLKPKQRNNFPASTALNRWTKPLQQQAGVLGLREPIGPQSQRNYCGWLRCFQAQMAKSLAVATTFIDLFVCRKGQRCLWGTPAVVQTLPEEQMLSWGIIFICKISHEESKHEPFIPPSPHPPPLSSALPWPCHRQSYFTILLHSHAVPSTHGSIFPFLLHTEAPRAAGRLVLGQPARCSETLVRRRRRRKRRRA